MVRGAGEISWKAIIGEMLCMRIAWGQTSIPNKGDGMVLRV